MIKQMQITEARRKLNELYKELDPQDTISITSRGKQVYALMSWEMYEAIDETLSILGDPELMESFKKGIKDIQGGRVTDWEEVTKELDIGSFMK